MSTLSKALATTAVACLALPQAACVTKGKYDDLAEELGRARAENDAQRAYARSLEERLELSNSERDALYEQVTVTETEVNELRNTYTDLVSELEAEVTSGQIEISELRNGVRLNVSDDILFRSGSAKLDAKGSDVLARIAGKIADGDSIVTVEGHTDDVPISKSLKPLYPTNWELAGARAASVVRLLSEHGVDPKRLRAVSRGPFDPLVPNDTPKGRAQNRRTEVLLRPAGP